MNSDTVESAAFPKATAITSTIDNIDVSINNGSAFDPRRYENVTAKDEVVTAKDEVARDIMSNTTHRPKYRDTTDKKDKSSLCSDHLGTPARELAKDKCVKKPWKDRSVYDDLLALDRSTALPKIVSELDELWKLNQIYEKKVSGVEFKAHLLRCVVNRHWKLLLILKETFEEMLDACQRLIEGSKMMRAVASTRREFGGFRRKKKNQGKKNCGTRTSRNSLQDFRARKNFRKAG
ncbi:hypothetical protein OXX69_004168 [Metschnikowia pulcherrima]